MNVFFSGSSSATSSSATRGRSQSRGTHENTYSYFLMWRCVWDFTVVFCQRVKSEPGFRVLPPQHAVSAMIHPTQCVRSNLEWPGKSSVCCCLCFPVLCRDRAGWRKAPAQGKPVHQHQPSSVPQQHAAHPQKTCCGSKKHVWEQQHRFSFSVAFSAKRKKEELVC